MALPAPAPAPSPAPAPDSVPADFAARFKDAKNLHKAGRIRAAADRYEHLVAEAPDNAQLLYLIGAARVELDEPARGVPFLERALAARPGHIHTIEMLGSAWMKLSDPKAALPYFQQAAALSADRTDALLRFADALAICEQFQDAAATYEKIRAREPGLAKASLGLAHCLSKRGDGAGAEALLRECIAADRNYAKAYVALASILGRCERFAEAETAARDCLAAVPDHAPAFKILAGALHEQGKYAEAEIAFRQAVRLDPDDPATATQLAETLIDLGRLDEAEILLADIQRRQPDLAAALTARGRIAERRGQLEHAITLHGRAIEVDPHHHTAFMHRGTARRFSGDFEGALRDYGAALALHPGYHPALANRGLALLTLGRLDEAWPLYQSRIKALAGAADLTAGRPWQGEPLQGMRVLVWLEYGLGDEIMFAGLLPELLAMTAHCTVVCSARLVRIFKRSFPAADIVPMGATPTGDYDVRFALTDAAKMLRPTLQHFPRRGGYLRADEGLVRTLQAKYRGGTGNRLIGLSWHSASGSTGRFKSIDLAQWIPILGQQGATFVSLQYGDCAMEVERTNAKLSNRIIVDPTVNSTGDLDTFAAQVAAMDLVVSVSNTTVHVAGALGRPVWALVPRGQGSHWYWFLERADSPWYPSARLFRQAVPGRWSESLDGVAAELRQWMRA